jgi:hypothetical protein
MKREIYRDVGADGVVQRTYYDDVTHDVTVEHVQDAQGAVDLVEAVNSHGGAPTNEGIGRPVLEIPVVLAMNWARARGIPWEKLLYSNEYDAEFKKFGQEYSRLKYEAARKVHTLQ